MAERHPTSVVDNSQAPDTNSFVPTNCSGLPQTNGQNPSSTISPEPTSPNWTSRSPQSGRAGDEEDETAEPFASCFCSQHPLRLERKLSMTDMEKLAEQEAPHWKSVGAYTCPVCSNNVLTYGLVSTPLPGH
ncbi:hypothetical protein AAVH_29462 [Aphelenchoides avenae]|nr:hypothetical protein AAVH_29462 [Aphelenchus avenae]